MASFILLVVEVWTLAAGLLLLHYNSPRFGFAPFLFAIGALSVLLQEQLKIYVQPMPGFLMFITSNVLVPVVLMSILVIYVADGAVPARMTIIGVMGVGLLVLTVNFVYRTHLSLPDSGSLSGLAMDDLVPRLDPRNTLASFTALFIDMLVIAIFYQGVKNLAPQVSDWVAVGAALLASLWTDAIIYRFIADLGSPNFMTLLPGDVVGKTLSALILWPVVAYYLTKIAPKMPHHLGSKNRRTLDVLFGSLEELKMALVRSESALEHSESERQKEAAYLQLISEHIEEALWLAAADQVEHAFYVNPAYERIWGRSAASLYADPLSFVRAVHPEDQPRVLAGLSNQTKTAREIEYRVIRPDGSLCWVRDRSFPILNEAGEVYRIAGITEDITESKAMEQKSLELAVEREKVKLLRDVVSEASHDLKAPLTGINLKLYMLSRTEDAEKRQAQVKEIERLSSQMSSMIDDLLTLARLDTLDGMSIITLDFNALVAEVCEPLRPLAEAKKQTFKAEIPKIEVKMRADRNDLARALANLIQNAIHYTPEGGTVYVEAEVVQEHVIIRVRDTGIGIAEADLPNIFNRFFRASNARTEVANGTGLGLAIVEKIIDRHHGRIECVSAIGKGTLFTVILPIAG